MKFKRKNSDSKNCLDAVKKFLKIDGSDPEKFLKKSDKDREGVLIRARQVYFSNIVNITVIASVVVFIAGLTVGPWIEITWNYPEKSDIGVISQSDIKSYKQQFHFIGAASGSKNFQERLNDANIVSQKELGLIMLEDEQLSAIWSASRGLAAIAIGCGLLAIFLNYFKLFNSRWSIGNDDTPTVLMYFPLIVSIYLIIMSIMKYTEVLQIYEKLFDEINERIRKKRSSDKYDFDAFCINPPGNPFFVSMVGLFFFMVSLVFIMDYYDPT